MKRCAVCNRQLVSSADEYGIHLNAPVCQICYLKGFEEDPALTRERIESDLHSVEGEIRFIKSELPWTHDHEERIDLMNHLDELRELRKRIKRELTALADIVEG